MSANRNHREPKNLTELIDEARITLKPDQMGESIDWEKLDSALFARIESESQLQSTTSGVRKSGLLRANRFGNETSRTWQIAGVFATAAALALALHRPATSSTTGFEPTGSQAAASRASVLTLTAQRASGGSGDVRIDGEVAVAGRALHALDTIETSTAQADFSSLAPTESAAPSEITPAVSDALRVAWRLEDHSHVMVRSVGGGGSPLVVELAAGSLEAQVTPVERGEAFAIDLRAPSARAALGGDGAHDVVRIAVHGTHLRVSRDPSRNTASIDLSEGVVSIGFPPKSGSTYGTLVTAPAHVEIDLAKFLAEGPSVNGSASTAIMVDKNPGAVRLAAALTTHEGMAATAQNEAPENTEPTTAPPVNETSPANEHSQLVGADHVAASSGREVDPHAEQTIIAATRACASLNQVASQLANQVETSNEVRVSVSSKLSLHIGADGVVRMARFEPPLTPAAQQCAGKTIYKTRFAPSSAAHDIEVPVEVGP